METVFYTGLYELGEPVEIHVEKYEIDGEWRGAYWVVGPADKNLNVSLPSIVAAPVVERDKKVAYRTVISRIESEITMLYDKRAALKKVVDL